MEYKTQYAKLYSLYDYTNLNDTIGIASNYPNIDGTDYYSDPNPTPIDGIYYMEITPQIQELYSNILNGYNLIDKLPDIIIESTIEETIE